MFLCVRKTLLIVAVALFFVGQAAAASAQKTAPLMSVAATPSIDDVPALANLTGMGVKPYYMGAISGLDGWLLVKDGRMQIAYVTPDRKNVIIGAIFGADGNSLTTQQVKDTVARNAELGDLLKSLQAAGQQPASAAAGVATPAQPPKAEAGQKGLGEQMLSDLEGATSVALGDPKAPGIYMIMDVDCPHCRATWSLLRAFVGQNKLRVHMVPVAEPASDNERAASVWLKAADPYIAWDKYSAGDKSALAGTAEPEMVKAVVDNHLLADKWHVDQTPFIVYRAKNGQIKLVKGEIKDLPTLLLDLGVQ